MTDRERQERIEAARWVAQEQIRDDAVAAGSADPWGTDDPPYWTTAGRRLRERWTGGN